MYYLKIRPDISKNQFTFIPADGELHGVTKGLATSLTEKDDVNFLVEAITWERDNPNNTSLPKKEIRTSHTLKIGEICSGTYSISEWSYLEGVYYRHPSFEVEVVDGSVALKESDDPVVQAQVHLEMGNYQKADELLNPILPPDPNNYYFVNREANKLQAQRYELGLGVEKNLDKAYIYYLYAQSFTEIVRFMDRGYGRGVFNIYHRLLDWNEYYTLKLLYVAGECEYAEYRMHWNANCWTYDSAEKEATKITEAKEHLTRALCRRQVCEWMMEKGAGNVDKEKFTLYLGAYFSYLQNGHEGSCSYVCEYDDRKYNDTSVLSAKSYIKEAIELGQFAIKANAFIDTIKEE